LVEGIAEVLEDEIDEIAFIFLKILVVKLKQS